MTKEMIDSQGNPKCPSCEGLLESVDVTYCKYCKPKSDVKGSSPQTTQKKQHRSRYEDTRTILKLKCVDCGKTVNLNVGNMAIYTEEVKKTWTCCLCSDQRKKGKRFVKRTAEKSKPELKVTYSTTVVPKTKLCKKCKTEKLVQEFGKDKATKDGLYYICKSCTKPVPKEKK